MKKQNCGIGQREEDPPGINQNMTRFIHPFPVNHHLFLTVVITGHWVLLQRSLGKRQEHILDSLSVFHTQVTHTLTPRGWKTTEFQILETV